MRRWGGRTESDSVYGRQVEHIYWLRTIPICQPVQDQSCDEPTKRLSENRNDHFWVSSNDKYVIIIIVVRRR